MFTIEAVAGPEGKVLAAAEFIKSYSDEPQERIESPKKGAKLLRGRESREKRRVGGAPDGVFPAGSGRDATFGDVSINHPSFQFIEALAASGIAGSCSMLRLCCIVPIGRSREARWPSSSRRRSACTSRTERRSEGRLGRLSGSRSRNRTGESAEGGGAEAPPRA